MKPNISEFSYGFAITDELINWYKIPIKAAPIFPSLYSEGKTGGGYDLKLDRPGIPLFLQFKLSDCLTIPSARETKDGLLSVPYFRMYIRPRYLSSQHEMLLDLERIGSEVYYSAPAFHEPYQLNSAYLTNNVRNRSIWVRPSLIGDIVDDEHHYVAFQHPGSCYFRSKHEKHIDGDISFEGVAAHLTSKLKNAQPLVAFMETADTLSDHLEEITKKTVEISQRDIGITFVGIKERQPLYKIAYYAHVFFGAQFFIIQER